MDLCSAVTRGAHPDQCRRSASRWLGRKRTPYCWQHGLTQRERDTYRALARDAERDRDTYQALELTAREERDKYIALAERLASALGGMLLSADANWELERAGHDWAEACVTSREALAAAREAGIGGK